MYYLLCCIYCIAKTLMNFLSFFTCKRENGVESEYKYRKEENLITDPGQQKSCIQTKEQYKRTVRMGTNGNEG